MRQLLSFLKKASLQTLKGSLWALEKLGEGIIWLAVKLWPIMKTRSFMVPAAILGTLLAVWLMTRYDSQYQYTRVDTRVHHGTGMVVLKYHGMFNDRNVITIYQDKSSGAFWHSRDMEDFLKAPIGAEFEYIIVERIRVRYDDGNKDGVPERQASEVISSEMRVRNVRRYQPQRRENTDGVIPVNVGNDRCQ